MTAAPVQDKVRAIIDRIDLKRFDQFLGLKPSDIPSLIKNMPYIQYSALLDYIKTLEERSKFA